MTKKGKDFVELVFNFAQKPSSEAKVRILETLEGYAKNVFDKNDVLNKLGPIENCSTAQHTKVIISRALVYYANHDSLSGYAYTNASKDYYAEIIIDALVKCTEGKTLEEAYISMGDFIQ